RYGRVIAVNDVSFSIAEGEIFGVIGPNGAGKTTTVECIAGLKAPDSGNRGLRAFAPEGQKQDQGVCGRAASGERAAAAAQSWRGCQALRLVLSQPPGSGRAAQLTWHQERGVLCVQEPLRRAEAEAFYRACPGGQPQDRNPR